MKEFVCDCVSPLWSIKKLSHIIDNAKKISRKKFLENCNISPEDKIFDLNLLKAMKKYPNDFEYYEYNDPQNIMFFTHSCIEHFYN